MARTSNSFQPLAAKNAEVLMACRINGASCAELSQTAKVSKSTCHVALSRLRRDGFVFAEVDAQRPRDGYTYWLTEHGRKARSLLIKWYKLQKADR